MRYLFPLLMVLAACGGELADPVEFDPTPRCGAQEFYFLLGKNAKVLDTIDLPSTARVLRPSDVITLDFSPERLTIDVDNLGLVASVTCR